jgi:phosphodiesterase/alkaline phosphatase D-like protein
VTSTRCTSSIRICRPRTPHTFAVIWDDHEVQNDYSGIHPEKPGVSIEDFIVRRAAAYRAFYEHLPMRSTPAGNGGLRVHRRLRYGDLAQLTLLDCRQFRPANPWGGRVAALRRCAGSTHEHARHGPGSVVRAVDGGRAGHALERGGAGC